MNSCFEIASLCIILANRSLLEHSNRRKLGTIDDCYSARIGAAKPAFNATDTFDMNDICYRLLAECKNDRMKVRSLNYAHPKLKQMPICSVASNTATWHAILPADALSKIPTKRIFGQ